MFAVLAFRVFSSSLELDTRNMKAERALFRYSILYLFILFGAVVGRPLDVRMRDREEKPAMDQAQIQARQRARAKVMGVLLGAFAILVFAISIVKMTGKG
jgi:hypothetical protein